MNAFSFKVVKLLDSKKSQALGIFITSLHLNVADIETGKFSSERHLKKLSCICCDIENC